MCAARSKLGEGFSEKLHLDVKCKYYSKYCYRNILVDIYNIIFIMVVSINGIKMTMFETQ